MTEVEEPQFTSLSARIAALNQQGVGKSLNANSNTGRKPPPPVPAPKNRPPLPTRGQTTNNPPVTTYGSAIQQTSNQPIAAKAQLLPPPPIDRDQPKQNGTNGARTPPLPARYGAPPLPGRKSLQPSPALPPRKTSTQLVRRGSNESTLSFSSTMSGFSLSQTGGSATSASSVESQRKLPPALGETKLPLLPPTRRELEERAKKDAEKVPLVSTKSAPVIPLRQPPAVERDLAPKMPPRPNGVPRIPSRPASGNQATEEEVPPTHPPRRLPPPNAARSALTMGFGNKQTPNPAPTPIPAPTYSKPTYAKPIEAVAVQDLTAHNFDSVISGKFALVDFYAPYCKYCVELEPVLKQLAKDFAFASDRLVIVKVDVDAHKSFMDTYDIQGYPTLMFFDGSNPTPEKYQYQRKRGALTDFLEEKTGINVSDGLQVVKSNGVPPPINMSSKPSTSQVKAVQAKPAMPSKTAAAAVGPSDYCWLCRDFSGPDGVAAQYPRQSLPRGHDQTGYLAQVLCGPFTSHTDKARAIFTWLHHNIAYDTEAFFNKNVKHMEPADTINTGLAVCAGYAGLFAAIALKAGLEAVVVGGHGKGFGYKALKNGDPIPRRDPSGHAWNACRIDNGEWKLLDACWGAGNVSDKGDKQYTKCFSPQEFIMLNEDFGIKHFPEDERYFFRADGRIPSWEEYMLGPDPGLEPVQTYSNILDHSIQVKSISPKQKHISVHDGNEVIRFQFSKVCEHWDHIKNGKGEPYCMIIKIWGVDGRKQDFVAMDRNEFWWWADIKARDLGVPGQTISLLAVTTVNEKDVRGMTKAEYLAKKGKPGSMGFAGIANWELI